MKDETTMFPTARPLPEWFKAAAARAGRDAAIEAVENSSTLWIDRNWGRMVSAVYNVGEFTSDALWAAVSDDPPAEPRVMGAVLTKMRHRNLIEPTDRFVQSARPECHARPVRVWRAR